MKLELTILAVLGSAAYAQVPFFGSCPNPPIQKQFDKARYLGTWYEYSNYFTFFQIGLKCVKAVYGDTGGNTISVFNSAIREGRTGRDAISEIRGTARLVDKKGRARLRVQFPGQPDFGSGPNYNVLFTDYDQLSIVWSCTDLKLANGQILWILTRDRHPAPAVIHKAMYLIKKFGLDASKLSRTDQKNCPYSH